MTTTEAEEFRALLQDPAAGHARGLPPAWFLNVSAALYEELDPARRDAWAHDLYTALCRTDGRVPLTVTHLWHTGTILPVLTETATRLGHDPAPFQSLAAAHHHALTGHNPSEHRWAATLEPALRRLYRDAYAYAAAYATAYDNAHAYALANDFTPTDADTYGRDYADETTEPNARAFTEANATANARATATAYATEDPDAYALTFPGARTRAYVRAAAAAPPQDPSAEASRRTTACARLADGLVASLNHGQDRQDRHL
ncbi:SpcZ [Streptomyces sp. NPDC050619]|uniref:SpcZ n=1 Tax=Streptomyces sp. NPDC050619 TaxID=3157214 RepID=UPI0034124FA6